VRFAALLDGTVATAAVQAQALAGFLGDGLRGDLAGETFVLYCDERDRERLVDLAPTRDVRLVKTAARRPERMVDCLTAAARGGDTALFLAAAGATGTEIVTRLACRAGGGVLTDALTIEARPQRLVCRKNVYSNHLVGRFELRARPWCVTVDACWNDTRRSPSPSHTILSESDESGDAGRPGATTDTRATGATGAAPFADAELLEAPSSGDLAKSRFLVVAGYGAASREGTERIADAARRMGADFGVSRPVAMNAWAPMDRLMGVSGTRAAPALCIVAGASGAPALYWGIEKAGLIVAVNPDERAPIVANSDAALLDDAVAVLEELAEIVAGRRTHE
jgi:electron transfer flavoprotein alpha subunit